jgi:hypothetical protein
VAAKIVFRIGIDSSSGAISTRRSNTTVCEQQCDGESEIELRRSDQSSSKRLSNRRPTMAEMEWDFLIEITPGANWSSIRSNWPDW